MSEEKEIGKVFHYKAGKQIASEGDVGKYLYHIMEGKIEIFKGGTHLRELGPGVTFGELGVLGSNLRLASIFAKTDVTLEAFDRGIIIDSLDKLATVEEKRATNNLINYIEKLDQIIVEVDRIKKEIPSKEKIMAHERVLDSFIKNNEELGRVLNNIKKVKDWIKEDIKKSIDSL